MSDVKEIDVKEADEKQANEEFAFGFDGGPAPEKAAGTEDKTEAKTETPPKAEAVKTEPAVEVPEYIQITKPEWERVTKAASDMLTVDKVKSMIFGAWGEKEQQLVRRLQSTTPQGMQIEIPADAFAEMEKDFPEIAAQMKRALKGIRGTGQANAKPDADLDEFKKAILSDAKAISEAAEIEAIEEEYENWREIVGAHGDKENPFRKWLAEQGPQYEGRINRAKRASTILRAIGRFKDATAALAAKPKTPAPKPNPQADRIRAAVQPKGDGGQPAPGKTANDEFLSGFVNG